MRLTVALGGNALDAATHEGRRATIARTAQQLVDLLLDGHQLVVTHGNGPQVGELMLDQDRRRTSPSSERVPLDVLVAMTQAQLGYRLQQAVEVELSIRGDRRGVVALVTQVVVAASDPAFSTPTKPVGPRYERMPVDGGAYGVTSDGRWRRLVPSPAPIEVIERDALAAILDDGLVPICAGGGGIPVVREGHRLRGVEAVVDKDLTSALLTHELAADGLLILTDVEHVERHHGTAHARRLVELSSGDARALVAAGEAGAGSMGPKLSAAATVADRGGTVVIAELGRAAAALRGDTGTRIVPGERTDLTADLEDDL